MFADGAPGVGLEGGVGGVGGGGGGDAATRVRVGDAARRGEGDAADVSRARRGDASGERGDAAGERGKGVGVGSDGEARGGRRRRRRGGRGGHHRARASRERSGAEPPTEKPARGRAHATTADTPADTTTPDVRERTNGQTDGSTQHGSCGARINKGHARVGMTARARAVRGGRRGAPPSAREKVASASFVTSQGGDARNLQSGYKVETRSASPLPTQNPMPGGIFPPFIIFPIICCICPRSCPSSCLSMFWSPPMPPICLSICGGIAPAICCRF